MERANRTLSYESLFDQWQVLKFNFLLIYSDNEMGAVEKNLGQHWDLAASQLLSLESSQIAAHRFPSNVFAWFNLGTNLLNLGETPSAAQAYDRASVLGLPDRMLRYQSWMFAALIIKVVGMMTFPL